jgi:hypothetical protein
MESIDATMRTELIQLQPLRIILLVLGRVVAPLAALGARQIRISAESRLRFLGQ